MSSSIPAKKTGPKLPPQNKEAEQTVLGSILIDKNAIFRVADILVAGVPATDGRPSSERAFSW